MAIPGTAKWQPYKPGVGSLRADPPPPVVTNHVGPNGMNMDEWSKSQGYLSAPPGQPWPSGQGPVAQAAAGPPGFPEYTGPSGNQEYQRIFNESLAKSRAGIEDQYTLALSEIARQQGVANQGLDKYAPQINSIYGNAGQALDQWGAASLQAQNQSPLQAYGPAGFGMMPIRAAMEAGKAGALSDEGYLRTGMQDLYDRQRAGANLAKQGMLSDISNRELDYRLKMADDDYKQRNEWNLTKWNADREDYWRRQGIEREDSLYARERGDKRSDMEFEYELAQKYGGTPGQIAKAAQNAPPSAAKGGVSAARAKAIVDGYDSKGNYDPTYANRLMSKDGYKRVEADVVELLNAINPETGRKYTPREVATLVAAAHPAGSDSVSLALWTHGIKSF